MQTFHQNTEVRKHIYIVKKKLYSDFNKETDDECNIYNFLEQRKLY